MDNKFLRDFITQQKTIIQSTVGAPVGGSGIDPKSKKSKYGTADGKHPFGDSEEDELLKMFIEMQKKKMGKRFVLDYWKKRIARLVEEDLS